MRRFVRWLWRAAVVLVLLVAVAVVLAMVMVPGMVETRLLRALREAGIDQAQASVRWVWPNRTLIRDVRLGSDQRLTADYIEVTYDLGGLLRGRVRQVHIGGAELRVGWRDGQIDLGSLDQLQLPETEDEAGEIPLDSIQLAHAVLIVERERGQTRIPLRGRLVREGEAWRAQLHSDWPGATLNGDMIVHRTGGEWHVTQGRAGGELRHVGIEERMTADVTVDVRFEAGTRGGGGELTLEPGSNVLIRALGRIGAASTGASPVPLRLEAVEAVEIATPGPGEGWSVRAPHVAAEVSAEAVRFDDLQLHQLHAAAPLSVMGGGEGWSMALLEAAMIRMDRVQMGPTVIDKPALRIEPHGGQPLARLADRVWHIQAAWAAQQGLAVTSAQLSATLGAAGGWVEMTSGGEDQPQIRAVVNLEGEASAGAGPTHVEAISVQVPMSFNAEPLQRGRWQTGTVRVGQDALPGISGTVQVADGVAQVWADWPLTDQLRMRIDARHEAGVTDLAASIAPTTIVDGRALGALVSGLGDIEIDGGMAMIAELRLAQGRIEPMIRLTLDNVGIHSREYQAQASGISGQVTLTGFDPLRTPGHQLLTARQVQIGKLELADGELDMRVEGARRLFIERAAFRMGNTGRFRMHAIHLDLDAMDFETDVFVEELNLGEWITLLSGEQVTGTGRLYGRIPVAFRALPQPRLTLGRGFIYAEPGGGTLVIADTARVTELLGDTRLQVETLRHEDLLQALTQFHYSLFKFDLLPDAGDMMLRVETRGVGRGGTRPVELQGVTINVHNFGELANVALFLQINRERAVDRLLDRFFDRVPQPQPQPQPRRSLP